MLKIYIPNTMKIKMNKNHSKNFDIEQLPGLEVKLMVVWATNLLVLQLLKSLQLPLFLEDLSLLSIAIIRKIVRTRTTEIADMMIIRIEVEERMPWWWSWSWECKLWCLLVWFPCDFAGSPVVLGSMSTKSKKEKWERERERERERWEW
jgi:hypothetical protein